MGMTLPGELNEVMGLMGVQFPGTDESALSASAGQFDAVAAQCSAANGDLRAAVAYVQGANAGPAADAFASYMGGRSNVSGTAALAAAARASAAGHRQAAGLVLRLKVATIVEASTIAVLIHQAKASTGIVQAVRLMLLRVAAQQAGARLRTLDAQVAGMLQA